MRIPKVNKAIANIRLKDGSSAKLYTWPGKDAICYDVVNIKNGQKIGRKGYMGNDSNMLPAMLDHLQKIAEKGIDVTGEWAKSFAKAFMNYE